MTTSNKTSMGIKIVAVLLNVLWVFVLCCVLSFIAKWALGLEWTIRDGVGVTAITFWILFITAYTKAHRK